MKKSIKLLILVLSVALIVGAMAVISGAATTEQKDNYVAITKNGTTTESNNFATTFKNAKAGHVIKLLGNQTVSAAVTNSQSGTSPIVIDLNGYTLDFSASTSAYAFSKGNGAVKFVGEGKILFGDSFCSLSNSAKLEMEGSGNGILLQSKGTGAKTIVNSKINNTMSFKNVKMDISYAATSSNVSGSLFKVEKTDKAAGVFVTFENCEIVVNTTFEDPSIDISSQFVFNGFGHTCYVLKNTVVNTTGNGICFDNVTGINNNLSVGAPYDIDGDGTDDGNYGLVMDNSSIICKPASSTVTAASATANAALKCSPIVYKGPESTSKVYIGNKSVVAGTDNLVNGFATATATTSSVTVENATLELLTVSEHLAGAAFNGPAYVNFLYGGKFILGGGALTAEGTTIEGTAQGVLTAANDGTGAEATPKYSVDFVLGAQVDAIPTGVVFDYAANASYLDMRATFPTCGYVIADAELKELLKYGPVNVYWYTGNAEDYLGDSANLHSVVSYIGKVPAAPEADIADVTIGNATLEFAGWATTYYYPGYFVDVDDYLTVTEGAVVEITPINENDIIANGSTRAYFPVYKVKSISVTYTWFDIDGDELNTVTVTDGTVPTYEGKANDYSTGVITVTHTGAWNVSEDMGAVNYTPVCKTTVSADVSGCVAQMTLDKDFTLNFIITEAVYNILSDTDKAIFTADGGSYKTSTTRDINEIFTAANYDFVITHGGYTATLSFSISVYDYCVELLDSSNEANAKVAYYVLSYMKAAYEYFEFIDNYKYDFSVLEEYATLAEEGDFTLPESESDYTALAGKAYIALDLTCRHSTIIGVTNPDYKGKVKVNGTEMELVQGEVVLEATNDNLTGTLELALDEDGDGVYEVSGTYSILDYKAALADTEAAEVVEALVNFAYYLEALKSSLV